MNDKEWWWKYVENSVESPNCVDVGKDLDDLISEAQRREREEIAKMVEGMIQKGPGGHGQCCVCQTCKFFNDECVCTENSALQDVINAIKERK